VLYVNTFANEARQQLSRLNNRITNIRTQARNAEGVEL